MHCSLITAQLNDSLVAGRGRIVLSAPSPYRARSFGDSYPSLISETRVVNPHSPQLGVSFPVLTGGNCLQVVVDVYANQAEFMMVFLSPTYPDRDWPSFEFEIGKRAANNRT